MPTHFQREVSEIAAQYPDSRSAVMPALRLAQERHGGWLPREAFVEVAEALDLTPGYVKGVASFYDMFHLELVGRRIVEVCTNICCGLRGAQGVLEAFERELGIGPGDTTEDGEFTLRTVECIRGEYLDPFESLRKALDEVRDAELLDGVTVVLHRGAGAYICGEESGLLESLEGKRGQPRSRPPYPAISGLYASPTLINNVETIATIPKVLELGGADYAKIGAPPDSTGTRLFCVSGNVVKGGNYEPAAAAGVEIPVFGYEPRLGAAIGACRMCLVEVEGMPPKPQAGGTLTAQDGMVVKTARTSEMARVAQNATLEFILVNHPLDCPVCDKGGECPLQDLTFRYGPGNTRMTFEKRTFEKPIPISPAISIDRERCILCYRCTRFSESVAEDNQLVAVNRGAQTMIATFEDEPYTGAFTGNVTELCPVGALLPTQPRFEIRPWERQSVPTVCGLCPVGCNIDADQREGKVKRILSRNHPEVDEGWLCDKGRFAFTHLYADDRIADPLRRVRRRGFEELSWDDALDEAEALLRRADGRIVTSLSGSETVEQAYALGKLLRQGLGAHSALLPEETSAALDGFRLPLAAIRDAELIVVLGDDPVVERAPIVDLWLRKARRNGAEIVEIGPAGDVQVPPGTAVVACRDLKRRKLGK